MGLSPLNSKSWLRPWMPMIELWPTGQERIHVGLLQPAARTCGNWKCRTRQLHGFISSRLSLYVVCILSVLTLSVPRPFLQDEDQDSSTAMVTVTTHLIWDILIQPPYSARCVLDLGSTGVISKTGIVVYFVVLHERLLCYINSFSWLSMHNRITRTLTVTFDRNCT